MTRDELINLMRSQTDLDDQDLPTDVAVVYLREAFQRTAAKERHWPAYESEWLYTVTDTGVVDLDPTTAEISSVNVVGNGKRLDFADHHLIKSATGVIAGITKWFSLWGGSMYVWPSPSEGGELDVAVSGYRKPNSTWLTSGGTQVDLDERLHIPLFHYAVALVYAQLEDPEMESMYMRRWEMSVDELHSDITKTGVYRPIVLNGGLYQQGFGY